MGVVCTQLHDYVTAGKYFEHARSLEPRNPVLLADMGYSAYVQKDFSSAESLLRESVQLRPGDARATNNLAMAIGFQGRYDESLAIFQRVNNETQARLNVAFIQNERQEHEMAMNTYRQVLASEPGNKVATSALQQLAATRPKPQQVISPDARLAAVANDLPGSRVAVGAATAEAEYKAPVITPIDDRPVQIVSTTPPAAVDKSAVVEPKFEQPERVEPPQELAVTVDEPVAHQPPTSAADDLSNVFDGGENVAEAPARDMEELAGLEWAAAGLAQAKQTADGDAKVASTGDWLRGFCPVALRDERRLTQALPEITAEHQGRTHRFSSPEARDKFLANPECYLPVAEGTDIIETKLGHATAVGTLDFACWFRHRLHLFSTADNLAAFRAAPRDYVASR